MKRREYLTIERLKMHCKRIKDPRRSYGHKLHSLVDILILTLLAVISGCETWEEIEDYGKTKKEWLQTFIALRNGIPSISTFQRVYSAIEPEALETLYRKWVYPYVGTCYRKQICVDGKTICGASKRANTPLHMVSALVREDGVTLGQVKTEEKSNEITAIPALLSSLCIAGATVSIDAMGCQREIARTILAKEAHYMLAVKMNQPTLHDEIDEYFKWAMHDSIEKTKLDIYDEISGDHGRVTKWNAVCTDEVHWFESKQDWQGLRSFVMVERATERNEKKSVERAYYISSLTASARDFLRLSRGHWEIENCLHWHLDVSFNEDACRIGCTNAAQNLSLIRKMALLLLKMDISKKASIARKRKIAGWDNDFALCILNLADSK